MLGPYRVPGPVEPDLPTRCTAGDLPCILTPHSPRFPASIGCPPPRPRAVPPIFAKALSAAATLFLLVASASLSAVTYAAIVRRARHAREHTVPQAVLPAGPRIAVGDAFSLGMMGERTHDTAELWNRAQALAAFGADITLARRALPGAMTPWSDAGALHVEPEPHKGYSALRILAVDPGSAPSMAGVRPGDLVTAVNGYPLANPELVGRAFAAVKEGSTMVAEIQRDGRWIVLYVDWKPKAH